MKFDPEKYTPEEQAEIARKFYAAGCFMCGGKATTYRKIDVRGLMAYLPLCVKCFNEKSYIDLRHALESDSEYQLTTRPAAPEFKR